MKTTALLLCLILLLGLTACAPDGAGDEPQDGLLIAATTYPMYVFTCQVISGAQDVQAQLLVNQEVSCLHDYSLSVADMTLIESADCVVMNGAGLEDFLEDVLTASSLQVIDACDGMDGLLFGGHEHHDEHDEHDEHHEEHGAAGFKAEAADPHVWLDIDLACAQVRKIASALALIDEKNAEIYLANAETYAGRLAALKAELAALLPDPGKVKLITFHDGFAYMARSWGLELLMAIEEESGSEISAKDMEQVITTVQQLGIGAIFTEKNGSTASAEAIARETGARVFSLDMIMSGGMDITAGEPDGYMSAMLANARTIGEAFG